MFDVRRVRSGEHSVPNAINADLDDFEELVHTYRRSIFRYALSSLRDRDLAETVRFLVLMSAMLCCCPQCLGIPIRRFGVSARTC